MNIDRWAPIRRVVLLLVLISASALGQIRVSTVIDESTASSKAVMTDLRAKIGRHPKQFTLVSSTKDSYPGVLVTADCLPQKEKTGAFVCYYTSHFVGGTSKSFMGGGIYLPCVDCAGHRRTLEQHDSVECD